MNSIIKILLIVILLNSGCSNTDGLEKKRENKKKNDSLFLLFSYKRSLGNCMRSEKTSNGTILYCDSKPEGVCNTGELILSSGEISAVIYEANEIIKYHSVCTISSSLSTISTLKQTSFVQEDKVKTDNKYTSIENCVTAGMPGASKLITYPDLQFTLSGRGRVGISADKIVNTADALLVPLLPADLKSNPAKVKSDAQECLNRMFSPEERNLITAMRKGEVSSSVTCTFYNSASVCPESLRLYE